MSEEIPSSPPRESMMDESVDVSRNVIENMAGDVATSSPTENNDMSHLLERGELQPNESLDDETTELIESDEPLFSPYRDSTIASRKATKNISIDMAGEIKRETVDEDSTASDNSEGKRMMTIDMAGDVKREINSLQSTEDASTISISSSVEEAKSNFTRIRLYSFDSDDEEPNAESFFEGILFAETTDSSDGDKKNTSYLTEQTFDSDDTKNVSSENKKRVPSYCPTCPTRGMLVLLVAVFVSLLMVILHATGAITVATAEKAVTVAPTISSAPSDTPSISSIPSFQPSESPSKSMTPTDEPTNRPSSSPTSTMAPSDAPSPSPTISWQPTVTPISSSKSFKLRLYWERGYFWQEESEETFWCVECTRCKERGREDGDDHGCKSYGSGSSSNCQVNDLLWIKDCNRGRGARFNVIQHKDENGRDKGYQLRLDGRNLCIERINMYLVVKSCDSNDKDQLWVEWSNMGKFAIRPYEMKDWREEDAVCVSNWHHPKDEEVVGMRNCKEERRYDTLYWEQWG